MNFNLPRKFFILITASFFFASCMSDKAFEKKVAQVLEENPEVLTNAIQKNPLVFIEALQEAAQSARDEMMKEREREEHQKFEDSFANPLTPKIRPDEAIRGPKSAPLVLVEYSDFECSFCQRGFQTVMALMEKYGDNLQFVYKHLPLNFHQHAMLAAQYYEALRLQSSELAFKFHDKLFDQHSRVRQGKPFFDSIAKEIGADLKKLEQDLTSDVVISRIEEDKKEAASFGMQGTPGFLINGVPVRGAYPPEHFVQIIEELQKRGLVTL